MLGLKTRRSIYSGYTQYTQWIDFVYTQIDDIIIGESVSVCGPLDISISVFSCLYVFAVSKPPVYK